MNSSLRAAWSGALALSLVVGGASGCGKKDEPKATADPEKQPAPLVVRDDTKGLTFSFIKLNGDFGTVQSIGDVPYEARDYVRVWDNTNNAGVAGPWVFVVDLRMPQGDGTYKCDVMSRDFFEKLVEERRNKVKTGASATAVATADSNGAVAVIIYGAEWCKPCHQVEAYLKSKGIPFIHKDIEADPNNNEEMQVKLNDANMPSGSIPVIDIAGKILVGFDAGAIDAALAAAQKK